MSVFKCKICGGSLEITENQTTAVCEYCGTKQTLPKLDDDRRAQMYDRANHFRRNNEFDKAMGIYEKILNEDSTDAEAYWSIVLCRYGIEYVEDPSTHKRVPTVNRAQFTSVFDDEDYKSAIHYADGYQKSIYEEEANNINEIQKSILAISQKEEPFDVFICYKETDNNGRRTPDSVLATELYHQLTQEGFKVFFSRITLEEKLGTAYEPYIFAALNSAKVMVVIGTKPEYFNAVWVKNEWSRYLALTKNGARKILIPAYRDMDPYDLPEEFSHLQAQDMSKLGFMQDLIRGIKKLTENEPMKFTAKETIAVNRGNSNTAPLLQRAFIFLEDGDWDSANEYCEKVLDLEPKNANAYLGKLMAELNVRKKEALKDQSEPFDSSNNYIKAIRFGDQALSDELKSYVDHINKRNETARMEKIYQTALLQMNNAHLEFEYINAANMFDKIKEYKDAAGAADKCRKKASDVRKDSILSKAKRYASQNQIPLLNEAIFLCESISGWKDADELAAICKTRIKELKIKTEIAEKTRKKRAKTTLIIIFPSVLFAIVFLIFLIKIIIPNIGYNNAVELMNSGKYGEAITAFEKIGDYRDAKEVLRSLYYDQGKKALADSDYRTAVRMFVAARGYENSAELIRELSRESIAAGLYNTIGLKLDRTVLATGLNSNGQCDVKDWTDIAAISVGDFHTVGLKSDGTVLATGLNNNGQCDVEDWTDIVAVSAGYGHTVGLKSDGTVLATGLNSNGQCDVKDWTDIVAISAGYRYTEGLKSDGTVLATGSNSNGQCNVESWTDIEAISAGYAHTIGLKSNHTVIAIGDKSDGQCDVESWTDIVAISAGYGHTVGLKSDGTVLATGLNNNGQCDVEDWTDIVAISAGYGHTVGLKSNGTVIAVGKNYIGQCNVQDWTNIKVPGDK